MWEILVSIPLLGLAVLLQTAVVSRVNLLFGSADLILVILAAWGLQERVRTAWIWAGLAGLLVGYISALPWFVPLAGYLLLTGLTQLLRRRVWQAPLLAMFFVCFMGTLMMHLLSFVTLRLLGDPLPLGDSFNLITLPSILLNLFASILVYPLIRDLAARLHPEEFEA